MKLLFDENLSPYLAGRLQDLFPESIHVDRLDLGSADDQQVWLAGKNGGHALVSKDVDYQDMVTLRGAPPKVIWIRRGNCSTGDIESMLRLQVPEIANGLFDRNARA